MNWKQRANIRRDVRRGVIDLRESVHARRTCRYTVPVERRYVGQAARFLPHLLEWRRFRCYRTVEEAQRAGQRLRARHPALAQQALQRIEETIGLKVYAFPKEEEYFVELRLSATQALNP